MKKYLSIFFIALALVFSVSGAAFASGQDIVKMNADIDISRDMTAGDVVAIGGNITVAGKVENNVVAVGGSVTLKPGSSVNGQVVVVGGDIFRDPSAAVGGRITQVYLPRFIPLSTNFLKCGWLALWATISIMALLGFLGLAVLLTAFIPEHISAVVGLLERSFIHMLLWGILWTILIVPVAVLLAISIIGIILIPLEILFIVLAFIIGYIASSILIGKSVLASVKKTAPAFMNAILGIVILFLIGFLPIIGPTIKAVFLVAGFGTVIVTRFGTIR